MCLCASKAAVIITQAVCCFCQILNGSIENGLGDDDCCFCVHVEVDTVAAMQVFLAARHC